MKKLLASAILALLMPSLLLPATARAEVAFEAKSRDLTAQAAFSSEDPVDPCLVTEVVVFATQALTQGPATPEFAFALVAIFRFNACTETHLQTLVGSTRAPDFQGDRPLTSASLAATITVRDFRTGEQIDVFVDMAWTGTGDYTRFNNHFHVQRPGFHFSGHLNGTSRQADAFGTVSDGVTDFTAGEAAEFAELQWVSGGFLEVTIG